MRSGSRKVVVGRRLRLGVDLGQPLVPSLQPAVALGRAGKTERDASAETSLETSSVSSRTWSRGSPTPPEPRTGRKSKQ